MPDQLQLEHGAKATDFAPCFCEHESQSGRTLNVLLTNLEALGETGANVVSLAEDVDAYEPTAASDPKTKQVAMDVIAACFEEDDASSEDVTKKLAA